MYFDIDKAQLSALGKLHNGERMEKLEVLIWPSSLFLMICLEIGF